MTLLPIAAPATPATGAGAGEAATTSGDFAALLALVAGTTPSPNGAPVLPEVATPAAALEPQADPVEEPGRDQALPPDAAAPVATPTPMPMPMPMPMLMPILPVPPTVHIAAPAGPPIPSPPHPAERPLVRVPVPAAAVEASPVLVEAPRPSAIEPPLPSTPAIAEPPVAAAATTPPPSPIGRPAAEFEATPAPVERALAEVVPPGRGRSSVTASASPVAVGTSPALEETRPAPAPAPEAVVAEALVQPLGSPTRPERAPVRVPAAPMAVEASPASFAAPPIAEDSPVVSENSVQEHRVPVKPLPHVAAPVSTPLPAAVMRTEATLPVDAPAPTTVAPPAVPEQIVSAVVPLHGRGDGRHEVTLELRPEDLGTIRVEVSVEQQTVHLTLHAAEPATARLLSAALAELRTALADAGLRAGDLAVGPDGGSTAGRRSRPGPPPTEEARDEPVTPARVRPGRPSAAGRLDLLL